MLNILESETLARGVILAPYSTCIGIGPPGITNALCRGRGWTCVYGLSALESGDIWTLVNSWAVIPHGRLITISHTPMALRACTLY